MSLRGRKSMGAPESASPPVQVNMAGCLQVFTPGCERWVAARAGLQPARSQETLRGSRRERQGSMASAAHSCWHVKRLGLLHPSLSPKTPL